MLSFDDIVKGWMRRALNWQDVLTDYESAAQILPLRDVFNRKGLNWRIDGGYDEAERVRLFLTMCEDVITRADMNIHVVRYRSNMKFTDFSHRDCLGALMGLGFERKCIGDIVICNEGFDVLTNGEIDDYLLMSELHIRHVPMKPQSASLDDWQAPVRKLREASLLVSRLRCDALIAKAFNLSRAQSIKLFQAGFVQLDQMICLQPDKQCETGQVLSARGYGKFVIMAIDGTSKKGKQRVRIGIYI